MRIPFTENLAPGEIGSFLLLAAKRTASHAVRHWLYTLGGVGLILLGILDSSIIPIPGSLDAMTIVLSAHESAWWPYYAFMATVGSVFGAYLTYHLAARRQGKEMLKKRLSRAHMKKVNAILERWGFGAIVIPALLPPPCPMVPFVIAAGAMQYPLKRFLSALTLGRAIRYTLLAFLGARYGRKILAVMLHHEKQTLYVLIGLVILIAAGSLIYWWTTRKPARLARAH
jgi:membrane protein YqaA with SNARE-associated domain